MAATGADATAIYVPPKFCGAAISEAIDAEVSWAGFIPPLPQVITKKKLFSPNGAIVF